MTTIAHFSGPHYTCLLELALLQTSFEGDVTHHNIVEERKEKADNDDSESKAPDDNDKWEKGRCFWSWHITTLPKGPSDQMSWSDQRLRTDQDPSEANLVILNFFSVLKETW